MPDDNDEIIGGDPTLLAALALARRVAPTRLPVLVAGESGTGKELVARLIHRHGRAPRGPLVAVNCGTLPRELADSELFGHERGAFTGAGARKRGWFEEADGGTLVLDEIGELALDLQPKLLRVLETGRLRRVGGSGEVAVDVRVVALTLRDLRRDVEQRRFRLDLFHRLAAVEVVLPPLRRRRQDIPFLVQRFLAQLARQEEPQESQPPRALSPAALEELTRQDWPGNVRELRNVVQRAAILGPRIDGESGNGHGGGNGNGNGPIGVAELGLPHREPPPFAAAVASPPAAAVPTDPPRLSDGDAASGDEWPSAGTVRSGANGDSGDDLLCLAGRTFESIERAVLAWALARNGGSRRRAARALGIPRSTFCDKVKRYGAA